MTYNVSTYLWVYMNKEIEILIKKFALQNAVKYEKAPQIGAVMGKLMGEHPELRAKAREISPLIGIILKDIASGSPDEWQEELKTLAPELIDELSVRKEPDKGLKPLPESSPVPYSRIFMFDIGLDPKHNCTLVIFTCKHALPFS
ncbi:hypothetical protein C5S42_08400 [Candidatus Methanomarinus sp.]|nr:hypothetical protein C5S42_08400 [ANME-2 cluster archaeon]